MCDERNQVNQAKQEIRARAYSGMVGIPGMVGGGEAANVAGGVAAPSRRGQSIHKGLSEMKLHHEASLRDITRAITIIDSNPQVLESVEFGEILQRLGLR